VSIVGCDANPLPYYRAKADAERVLLAQNTPVTIVRATQFHTLVRLVGRVAGLGPLTITVGDLSFQPVDPAWVAERLADLAVGPPPSGATRATDLAGPEVLALPDVMAALDTDGGRRRVLRLPPVGGVLRGLDAHSNLPGADVRTGGPTFAEWLATRPR
jgi:uncharacterized protein YbjT (DUF2867 family)